MKNITLMIANMGAILVTLLFLLNISYACIPAGSEKSIAAVFDENISINYLKLKSLGAENESYFMKEGFLIIKGHYNNTLVQVGNSLNKNEFWITLIEGNVNEFDWYSATKKELEWFVYNEIITLSPNEIENIASNVEPNKKYCVLNGEVIYTNCVCGEPPGACVKCTGFTYPLEMPLLIVGKGEVGKVGFNYTWLIVVIIIFLVIIGVYWSKK